MSKRKPTFQRARRIATFHRWTRIALCISLILMLNYLGMNFYYRQDITLDHLYSLTPETREYLVQLNRPVEVIVTHGGNPESVDLNQLIDDVRGILREYTYHANQQSRDGSISVRFVDILQQRTEAARLNQRFGIDSPFVVIVTARDPQNPERERYRIIRPGDFYEMQGNNRTAFLGEQVLTAAILNVSSDRRPRVYFLHGHGEMRPDDPSPNRGVSELAQALLQRNYEVFSLNLNDVDKIPSDADLALILSPQSTFSRADQEKLRRYLQPSASRSSSNNSDLRERSPGRLLLALDPSEAAHGLDDLLLDWGMVVGDYFVLEADRGQQTVGGDLLITNFGEHPMTERLSKNNLPVALGWSRPVREDLGRDLSQPIALTPLLNTSESSWGRNYKSSHTELFNPEYDLPGPLPVAMLAEKSLQQFGIQFGPRVLVFGSSDFMTNHQLGVAGNLILSLNSIRWLVEGEQSIQAPPRPINRLLLAFTPHQISMIRLLMVIAVPGVIGLFGLVIYFWRRH